MSKRFNTVNALGEMEIIDYEAPDSPVGEPIVDKTGYIPISDQIRSLPAGDISLQLYDFPDGHDTGITVPLARQRGVDIAELSTEIRNQQSDVSYRIRQLKDEQEHLNYLQSLQQQSQQPTGASQQPSN